MRLVLLLVTAAFVLACGGGALAKQAVASPTPVLCGAELSARDAAGTLVGSTHDSTTIRIAAPQEGGRNEFSVADDRHFGTQCLRRAAGGPSGRGVGFLALIRARLKWWVMTPGVVRLTFPTAGCWRLHSERAGGK